MRGRGWRTALTLALGVVVIALSSFRAPASAADLPSGNCDLSRPIECPRVNLRGADLRGHDLSGAVLHHATLRLADLRRVDLRNANLRFADLRRADLRKADLRGADLHRAQLGPARGIYRGVRAARACPPACNGADLSGANLSDANLSGADLTGANLSGADLTNADLTDAVMVNVNAANANFTDANLTGAVVSSLNLDDAILTSQTGMTPPQAPTSVTAAAENSQGVDAPAGALYVWWSAPPLQTSAPPVTNYAVTCATNQPNPPPVTWSAGTSTTYLVLGLQFQADYVCNVVASNAVGSGAPAASDKVRTTS